MFGIADRPDGFPRETGLKSYHKNRSYLCQSGREGKFYFFAFIKNGQRTVGQSIPRYTIDDEQAVVDKYREDVLCPGVTFGDIYMRRRHSVLVPLQEYVLDKCFYKRTILIGDSFHKVPTAYPKGVQRSSANYYYSLTLLLDKVETPLSKTQRYLETY